MVGSKRKAANDEPSRKRIKLEPHTASPDSSAVGSSESNKKRPSKLGDASKATSRGLLRNMIEGELVYTSKEQMYIQFCFA
jgi:hypothetical protein